MSMHGCSGTTRLWLVQVAREAAQQLKSVAGHVAVFDRKRKQEMALKLQQRWQRWEISNFDYLMQVPAVFTPRILVCESAIAGEKRDVSMQCPHSATTCWLSHVVVAQLLSLWT